MTSNVTINHEQSLYVIPSGDGYSCLGFDVALDQVRRLGRIYDTDLLKGLDALRGSLEVIERRDVALTKMRAAPEKMPDLWMDGDTPIGVSAMLKSLVNTGTNVRLFLGDRNTGLPWLNEYDTVGRIGKSMGPMKAPLLVAPKANGGGAILTGSVLAIQDTKSKAFLYQASNFFIPPMFAVEETFEAHGKVYTGATYQVDPIAPSGLSLHGRETSIGKAMGVADFHSGRATSTRAQRATATPMTLERAKREAKGWFTAHPAETQRWREAAELKAVLNEAKRPTVQVAGPSA